MNMENPATRLQAGHPLTLSALAHGAQGLIVAYIARSFAGRSDDVVSVAIICRDGPRMAALARALRFFAPEISVIEFPAWDCLPYDRVSPHAAFVAQRMTALSHLAQ